MINKKRHQLTRNLVCNYVHLFKNLSRIYILTKSSQKKRSIQSKSQCCNAGLMQGHMKSIVFHVESKYTKD
uniref:Uncharacterized protein n=1 Tax=Arundo donax TaxID=35708 RepID=A0A0A8XQC8_ARUDO